MSPSVDAIRWMQETFGANGRFFFDFFSALGGPYGWLLVLPCVFWLAGSKAGLRVAFPITLAMISNTLLKWALAQPRPYYLTDQVRAMKATAGLGMPSGHAHGVTAQWCALVYALRHRYWLGLACIFIVSTGASRIYLGLHSPMQVAAGWTLGTLTVIATVVLERPVVQWMRSKSAFTQFFAVVAAAIGILCAGYLIAFELRGDFATPVQWESRWQATVDRLVGEGHLQTDNAEFELIVPSHLVGMASLFFGFSLSGLWLLRTGDLFPASNSQRLLNMTLGCPLLAAIVLGLRPPLDRMIGEDGTLAVLGVVMPPLIAVVVPILTARLINFRDASDSIGA